MNILLDECTPRVVKSRLSGHNVRTVQEMGWAGLKNGELLAAADRHFDLFITTDKTSASNKISRSTARRVAAAEQSSADSPRHDS
jgi:hypothetical protein